MCYSGKIQNLGKAEPGGVHALETIHTVWGVPGSRFKNQLQAWANTNVRRPSDLTTRSSEDTYTDGVRQCGIQGGWRGTVVNARGPTLIPV